MKNCHIRMIIACFVVLFLSNHCQSGVKQKPGPITFKDVTTVVGLNDLLKGMNAHSAAWGDINNDGYPDLFVGTFANHSDTAST